jgi:hypothetical protein
MAFLVCDQYFLICLYVWGFRIQENNVSMIITDYWMPEMTGYELLKKVKVYVVLR